MTRHVVVDGSNIATEGRPHPSLAQLNEAVLAFLAEHPDSLITVVVDATFGHRIDPSERAEFDDAVDNNELVAPPAGAIGRGDAFVLSIANKVHATILSNDSFQEFHGEYQWLFDEGRLIGGKPVPHIGWVFVARSPVRGEKSRRSVKDAKRKRGAPAESSTVRVGSPEASLPMPTPKSPPPGRAPKPVAQVKPAPAAPAAAPSAPPIAQGDPVNDLGAFLGFVEHHPRGSIVNAVVESYSSHGAYVRIGDVKGYVPLRLMANPAPRSAREFMKIGEAVTLVVDDFAPVRRSIDLAVVGMSSVTAAPAKPAKGSRKKAAASEPAKVEPAKVEPAQAEKAQAEQAKAEKAKAEKAKAEKGKAGKPKGDKAKADTPKGDKKREPKAKSDKVKPAKEVVEAPAAAAAPVSAVPKPSKARAAQPEPTSAAPAPAPTPSKAAPAKAAPAKAAPAKAAPAKAGPAKAGPTKAAPAKAAPTKASRARKAPASAHVAAEVPTPAPAPAKPARAGKAPAPSAPAPSAAAPAAPAPAAPAPAAPTSSAPARRKKAAAAVAAPADAPPAAAPSRRRSR